ncbi:alkaline phosphatase [Acetomicrobium sp.]|jgi:alkaline phosphatase|uniref:alkaline phosphatase n=1 Tax=Acetomicrobium sp. TaxID=1872099 RepID=UPI003D96C7E3
MKMRIFSRWATVFLLLVAILAGGAVAQEAMPKNIILMIGDGMGFSQLTLGRLAKGSLAIEECPVGGAMTTHPLPSSGVITDSAAAGTALATGYKTDNGIISQTPEGKALYTVLENARDKGKATGLVTTTRITHATPAVFAAHIDDRDNENAIAEQLVNADVNVLLGGGLRHFIPEGHEGSKRNDDRNLVKEMESKGYAFAKDRQGLLDVTSKDEGKILGLFKGSHMSYELDRDVKKEPSIAEMTKAALEILSKDQEGFFLMVEGGRIDHASHANDTPTTMTDMMAFDEAVKAALDFAKMDGNTLVIVTADHATGGLSIGMGEEQWAKPEVLFDVKGSVEEKIAPMLKEDSSAEAIKKIAAEYMGITDLTDEEIAAIQQGLEIEGEWTVTDPIVKVINKRAHIGWTTHQHDGSVVPLFVFGPASVLFSGIKDNACVGKTIFQLQGELVQKVAFAVLSDPHLALNEPENTWKMFHYNQDILSWAIDEINERQDIDFVLVPGDLTKDSEPHNHRAVRAMLDKLNVPYYVIPGNHDVKKDWMPQGNFGVVDFARYYEGHGYDGSDRSWYSVDPVPGLHLIGLDSASHPKFSNSWGGAVTNEQIEWLEKDLKANSGKEVIVMVHHALVKHEGKDDPRNYVENADEVKRILHKYGVKATITGHLHVTDIAEENDLYDISSPALSSFPLAYRVMEINGGELSVNTIWYPDSLVREIARTELIAAGETKTGTEQIGEPSDRWASINLGKKEPALAESK